MRGAVIFDMDGVLINSTKHIWNSFNQVVKPYGIHFTSEDAKKYLGFCLGDKVKIWNKKYGANISHKDIEKNSWKIQTRLMKNIKPNPGIVALLKDLKKNKIKVAVGTSSERTRAKRLLRRAGIAHFFKVIISAEDIRYHKPHPDVYLKAAKKLKVNPKECVVIEDAKAGVTAAKRAGMKAVGFLTPYESRKDLSQADIIISSAKKLSVKKIQELISS